MVTLVMISTRLLGSARIVFDECNCRGVQFDLDLAGVDNRCFIRGMLSIRVSRLLLYINGIGFDHIMQSVHLMLLNEFILVFDSTARQDSEAEAVLSHRSLQHLEPHQDDDGGDEIEGSDSD